MNRNIPLSYWNDHPELYEQTMTGIDQEVNKLLARISELETENAKFLRMIYKRLHQAYQDQIVDTDMESIECEDGNIELFKSEWLATELEAWMQDETP